MCRTSATTRITREGKPTMQPKLFAACYFEPAAQDGSRECRTTMIAAMHALEALHLARTFARDGDEVYISRPDLHGQEETLSGRMAHAKSERLSTEQFRSWKEFIAPEWTRVTGDRNTPAPVVGNWIENAPPLPSLDRGGAKMAPRTRRERRIVWNLLRALGAEGFVPTYVSAGGEWTDAQDDAVAAMSLIFNLDDCFVWFKRGTDHKAYWIHFVLGNDCDIVSDYSCPKGSAFTRTLDDFDPEQFA